MNEIRDLKRDDRIMLWQYRGLNVQDGHTGIVLNKIIRDNERQAVLVRLDGIEEPFILTDKDYFDKLPLSHKKTQHSEDSDNVNRPSHYNQSNIEVIDIMEALPSEYTHKTLISLSNVIKYIFRAPFKNGKEDLKKAQWYLQRAVNNFEGEK
ncbi:DUF3310 domain-containing protein [Staphylococcus simulans]|uniref:DUF3310 domain-containing protein n=1 Tax=Staphylococcus simulans TaxID=1286 RepID=UPI000E69F9D9|nr:DUF3310 domain-containing protein [Staphylococcus simulans]RIN77808.1 DUF3310 domain-containing protein [Staphylococcus simulans]